MAAYPFLIQFLKRPATTGAVLPSGPELAGLMLDWLDFDRMDTVVEFGPGTGAFTTGILERSRPGTKYLGLEVNPAFTAHLRRRLPGIALYSCSAAQVRACLASAGTSHADAIVSGLPWALFSAVQQNEILSSAVSALRPGGAFATFAYVHGAMLPAARRFRRTLEALFGTVETSRVAWRNVPPAFVYRCRSRGGATGKN